MSNANENSIRVAFSVRMLKASPDILDPKNTESVYEYYLLENLVGFLIRDDSSAASGFGAGVFASWTQVNPTTWRVVLNRDTRWSDGSPILAQEVKNHLVDLAAHPARHTQQLRNLTAVTIESDATLFMQFSVPTDSSLLNELSLADSGLTVKSKDGGRGWSVTAGAYSVVNYEPGPKKLELLRNKKCSWAGKDSPETVYLFQPEGKDFVDEFTKSPIDLLKSGSFSFDPRYVELRKSQLLTRVEGAKSNVLYFYFGKSHALARSTDARRAFAELVRLASRRLVESTSLGHETQFIPTGFDGRVLDYSSDHTGVSRDVLKGKTVQVTSIPHFKNLESFWLGLQNAALAVGCKVEVQFEPMGSPKFSEGFAAASAFVGNQKDPKGSWSFLLNAERGPLGHLDPRLENELPTASPSDLKRIHQTVLDEAYGVPFAVDSLEVYHSPRVDISRWNLFDMRMRFYEIRVVN